MDTDIRWWVAPPAPDESIGSLVARAAALYESDPASVWRSLHDGEPVPLSEVDDPSPASLQRLAHALGTTPAELHRHRIEDGPAQLSPEARQSYCPVCRRLEAEAGGTLTQRCSWARVLRTMCAVHGVPLLMAFVDNRLVRHRYGLVPPPLCELEKAVLALIDRFALTLETSLFDGVPWPEGWRGDAARARALVLKASFNTDVLPAPLAIANVCASPALGVFIHAPRHLAEPTRKADWEAFRHVADPAIRRAALWIAAWRCVPDLPEGLCPGWLEPGLDV